MILHHTKLHPRQSLNKNNNKKQNEHIHWIVLSIMCLELKLSIKKCLTKKQQQCKIDR